MSVPTPLKQTHLTALALVPPLRIQELLFPTRNIHDRSSSRYPAHITLPFIEPSDIGATVKELRKTFSTQPLTSFNLEFESTPGVFRGRKECIIHLLPTTESTRNIRELWLRISRAVDPNYREDARRPFAPHLTLGQAPHDAVSISLLEDGAKRIMEALAAIQTEDGWTISSFVVLRKDLADNGAMKPYASVPLDGRGDQEIPRTLSTATWPMYMWDSVVNAWTLTTAVAPSIDTFPRGQYQPLGIVVINSTRLSLEKASLGISDDADILVINDLADHILTSILAHPDVIRAFPHSSHSPQMTIGLSPGPLIISRTPISVRRAGSNFVIDADARGRMAVPFATSAEESDTELMELLQTPGLRLILDCATHGRTGSGITGWRSDGGHLVAHGSRLNRPRLSASSVAADVLLVLDDTSPEYDSKASPLDADDIPFTDADFLAALPSFSGTSSVSLSPLASAALNSLEYLFRTECPSMDGSPSEKGPVKIGFAVVGAAAFGLEDDDDLVEISAIGNISPKVFRGLLLERLGVDVSQEEQNFKVKFDVSKVRRVGETTRYGDAILTVPVVDGAAGLNRDARVKIWYAMNAELVERRYGFVSVLYARLCLADFIHHCRWTGSYVAEASSVRAGHTQQPLPALHKLAVVTKLRDDAPLLRSFQISYSAISMLARVKSGWSARYGYLSSGLLFDVLAATAEDTTATATFISRALSRLSSSSPSPYSPAATFQSVFVRRIASAIRRGLGGSASLASLTAARHADPFRSFIQDADRDGVALIRVNASYWGAGSAGRQETIMAKVEQQLIAVCRRSHNSRLISTDMRPDHGTAERTRRSFLLW